MLNLTKTLIGRVTRRHLPQAPADFTPLVGETDPTEILEAPGGRELFEADGQTFLIEYQGTDGEVSRRLVSALSFGLIDEDRPYLTCLCHERAAPRHFRLERILRVVDLDGAVHAPPGEFLADVLGMPTEMAAAAGRVFQSDDAGDRDAEHQWQAVRKTIAAPAQILCALSHSDGLMSSDELDIAIDHMKAIAPQLADGTVDPDRARLYVRSLRPTAESLNRALEDMRAAGNTGAAVSLVYAGKRLIQADGVLDDDEVQLLNAISRHLIGAAMV